MGSLFHVDAAQSFGKLDIDVEIHVHRHAVRLGAQAVRSERDWRCLYVRRDPPLHLTPLIHGGGHEMGMRSGTLATHQIVGLGEAAELMRLTTCTSRAGAPFESCVETSAVTPSIRFRIVTVHSSDPEH